MNKFVRSEDMSDKTLEFAKERISSGIFVGLENIATEKIKQISYQTIVKHKKLEQSLDFDGKTMRISVSYNPGAEFDYLASERCCCDGTLVFAMELCEQILIKLLSGKSCYEPKKPKELDEKPWDYDVELEVGDFVFVEEYGENFSTKEKLWMTSRFTVMLPVKCDFKKKR